MGEPCSSFHTARAGNRRFWLFSAMCAHTQPPYKTDLLRKMLRPLNHPGRGRTKVQQPRVVLVRAEGREPHLPAEARLEQRDLFLAGCAGAVWWY